MRESRRRVLIGMSSDIFLRNFAETGAFDALAGRFDVHWFATDAVKRPLPARPGFTDAGRSQANARQDWLRYHMRWIAIFAGHRRGNILAIKRRHAITSRRERWPYLFLSLPGVWHIANLVVERLIPANASIERIVGAVRPDVIMFPSQGNDPIALDLMRAARSRRIPTVMLNYNWDNTGSKGPMYFTPDCLCVWGEDMARLAEQVHRLQPERVKVIGAAQFEQYFDPAAMQAAAAAAPASAVPRLLFAGNSRGHAEEKYLLMLDRAVETGELPPLTIVYRPHPWRAPRTDERSFEDFGFRHVEMDPQLAAHFRGALNAKSKVPDRTFAPSMDYNARLLHSVAGVLTPLSTLALEAALVGVPVLGLNFFSEHWLTYALDQFEHLQRIKRCPGVTICHDERRLIADVAALLRARDSGLPARMREAVRPIVHSDGGRTTYAERLADVVGTLLGQPSAAPAQEPAAAMPALARGA
jgi:hypothetical protein